MIGPGLVTVLEGRKQASTVQAVSLSSGSSSEREKERRRGKKLVPLSKTPA